MKRVVGGWVMAGLLGGGVAFAQAATDEAKTVRVEGDRLEQTVRCNGHAMVIAGSDSRLSVLGPCTEVRVEGSRNFITVSAATRIVTAGDQNTVEYMERRTKVRDLGKGNSVAEKFPQ